MRNSQHADERLDAEQADDTEEGDPAQHQDEHWLGPEMFVSDPDEDAADPDSAGNQRVGPAHPPADASAHSLEIC
jgi:hypothetical protein